jgi:hypothetical protein
VREPAAARASALAATAALAERGERYTAARLDLDFAMQIQGRTRAEIAGDVAERFDAIGARASAARARIAAGA